MENYTTIVGMEIHVELKTNSKMFCGCKNDPFHASKPNIYTCPVCLGLPGALPVPNKKAIEWTIMLGLALNCDIPLLSKFDRKNYFYPDLPKGYQISQYDQPLAKNGYILVGAKKIRINRVHLEEDTGKLQHTTLHDKKVSLIDFNRSGVPLVEIVTEPDIRSAEEAKQFLKKLHQVIRYLGISDADMEKGSMRLEPNISVKRQGESVKEKSTSSWIPTESGEGPPTSMKDAIASLQHDEVGELPNYKVEVKNINSFNFVKRAIEYETNRHIELLQQGKTPKQETMGWDEKRSVTLPQRSKEEAHDYRYFPEPDIPPLKLTRSQIADLRSQIPELPDAKLDRFVKDFQLPLADAQRLTDEGEQADYFEKSVQFAVGSALHTSLTPKTIANWMINKKVDIQKITPEELVRTIASATTVVQVDDKELEAIVQKIIAVNTKAFIEYKSGKTGVIMFLVGQVMKELKGKGDAQTVRKILEEKLQQ